MSDYSSSVHWRDLKYAIGYLAPASALVALYVGGLVSFLTPFIMFVIIPGLEFFFTGTDKNFTKEEEETAKGKWVFDSMLYLNVPIQWGVIIYMLFRVTGGGLETYEIVGMVSSVGMCCGVLGVNVAHELGHRRKWYEQWMAKALLLSTLYMQFFIEHNRGHHKNVATDLDPASARYGETIYLFIPRSIIGGYLGAWKLEFDRLRKTGQSLFTWNNEMVRYHVYEIAAVSIVFWFFGWLGAVAFVAAAAGGYFLLESVNYIEHYGLRRQEVEPGRFEKCMPWHSWNSDHTFGRIMLYDLTRHSDHHYLAGRKYQVLRHFEDSPQLPIGYPAAIVLSYFPPLWFAYMHPKIAKIAKGAHPKIKEEYGMVTA
ncbi:alkane 1-monooxygenase [soil metagenome]